MADNAEPDINADLVNVVSKGDCGLGGRTSSTQRHYHFKTGCSDGVRMKYTDLLVCKTAMVPQYLLSHSRYM